jgi:hypothetical protein
MRDIQCPHCESYINAREIVTRCTECGKNIYEKPKTEIMKATLENFLIKWDGNNPLWKEFIEWLNKAYSRNLQGESSLAFYGAINNHCTYVYDFEPYFNESLIITLEQWQQLLNPKTMNNFKKGDKVFYATLGWCEFFREVENGKSTIMYENQYYEVDTVFLSFTEYNLEGFTQERPFEPVVGQYYYYWRSHSLKLDCVGLGKYLGKSNDELAPYKFGKLNFPFCSETNPLL